MARCAVCGKEVLMPFKCAYCGEYFCAEHRLPEKHNCPGLMAAASPHEKEFKLRRVAERREFKVEARPSSFRPVGFEARREVVHLLAGVLLVTLVGFSLIGYNLSINPLYLAAYVVGFAGSFLLHELGHRAYARSKGLYARFKLDPFGALLTLVTAMPFIPFKIIAPGAVVVAGIAPLETLGMIALAGPMTNLALSAILNVAGFILRRFYFIFFTLAQLNAFIALFNLIPFGELDGRKILAWSPARWIAAIILSAILLITSNLSYRWI